MDVDDRLLGQSTLRFERTGGAVLIVTYDWAFLSVDAVRGSYAPQVPVSRKRKKKSRKSRTSTGAMRPQQWPELGRGPQRQRRDALADLDAHRRRLHEHRASLAAPEAEALIARLVELAQGRSESELEDDLCAELGATLLTQSDRPVEDHVGPN